MKKLSIMAVVVFLMMCMCASVFAEAIDINAMTYEELESLKSVIDTRMEELRRQYAIENGNRVISFDSAELKLFEKQRQQLNGSLKMHQSRLNLFGNLLMRVLQLYLLMDVFPLCLPVTQ